MKIKRKKIDYINAINTLLFIVMVSLVLLQIFVRYVVHISLPWTEEFARFLLICITFIGAALAVRDREHIAITSILDRLPNGIRYCLRIGFIIAIIVFLIIVFKGCLQMINLTWENTVGSVNWLTWGKIYLILLVCIIIMMYYLLVQLIENWRKLTKENRRK